MDAADDTQCVCVCISVCGACVRIKGSRGVWEEGPTALVSRGPTRAFLHSLMRRQWTGEGPPNEETD